MLEYWKHPNPHPQRLAAAGVLLCSFMVITACKGPQAMEQQVQTSTVSNTHTQEPAMDSKDSAPDTQDVIADLNAALRKGMAYGNFRKLVLDKGWTPVVDPQCRANLVGDDAEAFCAKNPQLESCKICDELPELESCSNDAHCLVRFRHPDAKQVLEATGYGEVKYWNETGDDAGLQVTGWEFKEGTTDK